MKIFTQIIFLFGIVKIVHSRSTAWELIEKANAKNKNKNNEKGEEVVLDIVVSKVTKQTSFGPPTAQNAAIKFEGRLWPGALIPYTFARSLARMRHASRIIKEAMSEWEKSTCIRFAKRTNEVDYVEFAINYGCNADVGRRGGKQIISLGDGCLHRSVVVHEIGHVIGFWHEQNRPDRDKYVEIFTDNIMDAYKPAFSKFSHYRIDSLNISYDYHSIMHYGMKAFSKNNKDTIRPRRKDILSLGNDRLSRLDIKQTKLLYKCSEMNRGWTTWSMWTNCDKSCGGGTQERTRVCTSLKDGRQQCDGDKLEKRVCNIAKCPGWPVFPQDFSFEHLRVDRDKGAECVLAYERADYQEWNSYSFCNRGKRNIEMRWSDQGPIADLKCTQIFEPRESENNGWYDNYLCLPKMAPYDFIWSHEGRIENLPCIQWYAKQGRDGWDNNFLCAKKKSSSDEKSGIPVKPTHGKWSDWSSWSRCNKECGGGRKRRLRICNNPKPSNGGKTCLGSFYDDQECNTQDCPTCGGILKDDKGEFHSPNYPSNYPSNTNCTWIIQGNSKDKIKLTITSFHFEKFFDEPCKFDYLQIREMDSNGRLIGTFCGNDIPKFIESKGTSLWINMITDRQDNRAGFRASWELKKTTPENCGGHTIGMAGTISTPNFPRNYPPQTTCVWIIEAPEGYDVHMKFIRFDVEKHSICKYDSVEVRDGSKSIAPLLGRYCGNNPIKDVMKTNSNKAYIKFISDRSTEKDGFKLSWRAYRKKKKEIVEISNKIDGRVCPDGWVYFGYNIEGGACYKTKRNYFNWYAARDDCLSNRADLLSITTKAEQDFVTNDLLHGTYMWLGMTDEHLEGRWAWSDNTTTTNFNNWDLGDPNDGGRLQNEDCALIKPDGKWNDYPCQDRFNYICKGKPLEPWNVGLNNRPQVISRTGRT